MPEPGALSKSNQLNNMYVYMYVIMYACMYLQDKLCQSQGNSANPAN